MVDNIPKRIADYRERDFWDRRYASEEEYEWLMNYDRLRDLLGPFMKKNFRILLIGCELGAELYDDGYRDICNMDYSLQVINKMNERYEQMYAMSWLVMDMRRLTFPDDTFDLIIDKASLDAIWTDGGSVWNPSTTVLGDIAKTTDEILRTLKVGGTFVSISFGQPHFRLKYFERDGWNIKAQRISETFYFIYTAVKK